MVYEMIKARFSPIIIAEIISAIFFSSCSSGDKEHKDEQIRIVAEERSYVDDSLLNSIPNTSLGEVSTIPNRVILTGLSNHRLVTVYKSRMVANNRKSDYSGNSWNGDEVIEHFMPGIDILYGYNLLNIAHYDLKLRKLNFLFKKSALIKTFYYPSFEPDSLNKQPINRNYYLVSVYDDDTNKDTLINRKDLRHFYHFNESCDSKTSLIPNDYSVIRSEYDSQNDVMYVFAKQDINKNGIIENSEPLHIFWVDLKAPVAAERLY